MTGLTLAVAIVTRGRPAAVSGLLRRLAAQTRRADMVILSDNR